VAQLSLENGAEDFAATWHAVGGEGDLDAALGGWSLQHKRRGRTDATVPRG
jgi:hypothetical protein